MKAEATGEWELLPFFLKFWYPVQLVSGVKASSMY